MSKLLISLMFMLMSKNLVAVTVMSGSGSYSGLTYWGLNFQPSPGWRGDFAAGYTPRYVAGEDLYSISSRFSLLSPYFIAAFGPYMGVGIVSSFMDKDTFHLLPDKYPSKYYPATGYYFSPHIGVDFAFLRKQFFFEISTLDYYIEAASRSDRQLNFREVTTFGFGIRDVFN